MTLDPELSGLLGLLRAMPPATRERMVDDLPPGVVITLDEYLAAGDPAGLAPLGLSLETHQQPPPWENAWDGWVMLSGRGGGKSYAMAAFVAWYVRNVEPQARMRVVAPTFDDAVASCVDQTDPASLRSLDPDCTWHPSEPGGAVLKWPTGARLRLIGTPTLRDVDRLRAAGNVHCFPAGVLVETAHGRTPIEDVHPGDLVWTRRGLRRVLTAGQTGVQPIWQLEHERGILRATAEHLVWTQHGWKSLAFLEPIDILRIWPTGSSGAGLPGISAKTDISAAAKRGPCSTVPFGNTARGLCPKAATFITGTMTSRTTTSRIWLSSRLLSIARNIRSVLQARRRKLEQSDGCGLTSRPCLLCASCAASNSSIATLLQTVSNSARGDASTVTVPGGGRATDSLMLTALSAGKNFGPCATPPRPTPGLNTSTSRLVPARVLRLSPTGHVEPVYDLTVEGAHEFFADGVLVHNCDWFEEAAANPLLVQAVEQADLGRRLGDHPRWIASTTPRPLPVIRSWLKDPAVVVTQATTHDNPHLAEAVRARYERLFVGTRMYRQEILGEVIDEVEGALWTPAWFDRSRLLPGTPEHADALARVSARAVGVDPPAGTGTCGIVTVARSGSGPGARLLVLEDASRAGSPAKWSGAAVDAAVRHDAPLVVEINQGGQMAVEVLEQAAKAAGAAIKVHTVWAAQGKRTRAEPIALMWEREPPAAHVVGVLPLLEDECCSFVPGGPSPDRMDACVWAAHYLMSGIIDWSESELHAPGQGAAPRRPGGRHRPSFAR